MHATRSAFRSGRLAVATFAVLALFSAAADAAETLSVVTFGGAYENAAKKAYFEPFYREDRH